MSPTRNQTWLDRIGLHRTGLTSPAHRARQNVESVNGWLIRSAHPVRNSADRTQQRPMHGGEGSSIDQPNQLRDRWGTGAIFYMPSLLFCANVSLSE